MVNCSAAGEKEMAGPSCSKDGWGEKDSHAFTPFMLPGKILQAEWDESSSLGENMRQDHKGQINLRAKQKFRNSFCYTRNILTVLLIFLPFERETESKIFQEVAWKYWPF